MPANRNRVFPLAILLLLGITSRVSVSAVSSSGGSEACEFQGGAARRRLDNLLAGFGASTDHDRDRAERENGNADGLHGFGASATAANANSSGGLQLRAFGVVSLFNPNPFTPMDELTIYSNYSFNPNPVVRPVV